MLKYLDQCNTWDARWRTRVEYRCYFKIHLVDWVGSQYFASFCDRNCRVSLHGFVFNCSLKLQTLSADTISIKTTQTLTISSSFCFHYVSNCNWIKRTSFRKIIVVSINYFLVNSVIVGCFCHSTQFHVSFTPNFPRETCRLAINAIFARAAS